MTGAERQQLKGMVARLWLARREVDLANIRDELPAALTEAVAALEAARAYDPLIRLGAWNRNREETLDLLTRAIAALEARLGRRWVKGHR